MQVSEYCTYKFQPLLLYLRPVRDVSWMSDQSVHLAKWMSELEQVTARHLLIKKYHLCIGAHNSPIVVLHVYKMFLHEYTTTLTMLPNNLHLILCENHQRCNDLKFTTLRIIAFIASPASHEIPGKPTLSEKNVIIMRTLRTQ